MAFWNKKKPQVKPRLPQRGTSSSASKVGVEALAPPAADYLASAVGLQSRLIGVLAECAEQAWASEDSQKLMGAAGHAMDRYRAFLDLLEQYVDDVPATLAPAREKLSRHIERLSSERWYENLTTAYVLTGFTRDFWHLLARGLPQGLTTRAQEILADQGDEDVMAEVLGTLLDSDERYRSRVSLWSRRLVGDVMLICRDALSEHALASQDTDAPLEPVFTEVLAHHTRRLDRLGLTA
jgi:hypothetical protein